MVGAKLSDQHIGSGLSSTHESSELQSIAVQSRGLRVVGPEDTSAGTPFWLAIASLVRTGGDYRLTFLAEANYETLHSEGRGQMCRTVR